MSEVYKMIIATKEAGGDPQKVYDKIINGAIETQKTLIEGDQDKGIMGLIERAKLTMNSNGKISETSQKEIDNAKNILSSLEALKDKHPEDLLKVEDVSTINSILNFLKNPKNALVHDGKKLCASLRFAALAFECLYLGFGLPALNQKRLEKKYLKNNPQNKPEQTNTSSTLINKSIKANEVKLYNSFVK